MYLKFKSDSSLANIDFYVCKKTVKSLDESNLSTYSKCENDKNILICSF